MSIDIKRLLSKRGWTGREVGQALLLSLTDRYIQVLQGNKDPKPLFSQAQLVRMTQSLSDHIEGSIYNRYIAVNNWLMQYQAVANAYLQQLQGDINTLFGVITTALAAEEETLLFEKLPVIMTQKQLEEHRAQRIEEQLVDDDGEDLQDDVMQLVSSVIEHFVSELTNNPKKANPFKAIRKQYMQEKVSDPRILGKYNEVYARGFYLFGDGRRSDQMTEEEWHEAALSPEIGEALKEMEARGDLFDPTGGLSLETPAKRAAIAIVQRGPIPQAIIKEGADLSFLPCSWTLYEDPPEDLCKWDVLENFSEAGDYYPALFGGEHTAGEYFEELLAFKKEFPEAVEAALKEIDKILGEPISQIPLEEWEITLHTWRQLYEIDFPGFKSMLEAETSIYNGDLRALRNGIAILQPAVYPAYQNEKLIDDRGYYIEPEIGNRISAALGLGRFTPANEDHIAYLEEVERQRNSIEHSIYWLKGFDFVIETLAEVTDIQNFVIFKAGIEPALRRIEDMNDAIKLLRDQIRNTYHQSEEAKRTKLQVLDDVFYHFRGKEIELPEAVKKKARKAIADLKIFEINDGSVMQLFEPSEREEED